MTISTCVATLYTGLLADNGATAKLDERCIGDGLNTVFYGIAPVNGEIED